MSFASLKEKAKLELDLENLRSTLDDKIELLKTALSNEVQNQFMQRLASEGYKIIETPNEQLVEARCEQLSLQLNFGSSKEPPTGALARFEIKIGGLTPSSHFIAAYSGHEKIPTRTRAIQLEKRKTALEKLKQKIDNEKTKIKNLDDLPITFGAATNERQDELSEKRYTTFIDALEAITDDIVDSLI